jgi:hypothetical protein
VQGAWISFVRNPASGLESVGWPLYEPTKPTLAQLGNFQNATSFTLTTVSDDTDLLCGDLPQVDAIGAQLLGLLPS